MTVRMQDIAADLNLSKMTISKVLRGQMDVSEKTKARVMQRVKELNYRPNISARSLRTGRTLNIGLVVPSLSDAFYTLMARSIVQQLRRASYSVSLSSAEFDPELEIREIEQQLSWQVDALILASVQTPEQLLPSTKGNHTPLVHVHVAPSLFKSNAVDLRSEEIGYLAASHLSRIGCRRIANVGRSSSRSVSQRLKGFRMALSEAGLRYRPELSVEIANESGNDYEGGVVAGQALLKGKVCPDGIVCDTDLTAVGVMDVLANAGIVIPQDIAVIGCGNDERLCEMRIPLSSVDLSAAEIGQQAAKLALKLLSQEKPGTVKSVLVSPTLVVRASTARRG